ncbi:uncharacterized protein LOC119328003 isoform X2 [Triticum dicoccoides]|uniref:uncharacterized protein LOC119328003 isoform X2 n=1 Tax=Triticum dicoccoides TaxID=85692 RepID=UPI0018914735|nr:uncharacterized protein LOC119328003 isoform X2 [Triticum dicoccoides]
MPLAVLYASSHGSSCGCACWTLLLHHKAAAEEGLIHHHAMAAKRKVVEGDEEGGERPEEGQGRFLYSLLNTNGVLLCLITMAGCLFNFCVRNNGDQVRLPVRSSTATVTVSSRTTTRGRVPRRRRQPGG